LNSTKQTERISHTEDELRDLIVEGLISDEEIQQILNNQAIVEKIAESHYFDDSDCSKIIIPFPTYEDACLFSIKVLGKDTKSNIGKSES